MNVRVMAGVLALLCAACTVPCLAATDAGGGAHDDGPALGPTALDGAGDRPATQGFPVGRRYVIGPGLPGTARGQSLSPGPAGERVGVGGTGAPSTRPGRFSRWYPSGRRPGLSATPTGSPIATPAPTPPGGARPTLSPGVEVEPGLYRFPAAELEAVRNTTPGEWHGPDDTRYGGIWKSTVDPMQVLAGFTSLRVRDGYVLRAYVSRTTFDSRVWVFAMPADRPFPGPNVRVTNVGPITRTFDYTGSVIPPEGDEAIMAYIESDGSPRSYLEAMVFEHEVTSFAEYSHSLNWSSRTILDTAPVAGAPSGIGSWRVPGISYTASPPEAWSPTVRVSPETVTATMYSIGLLYPANGVYRTTVNFTPGTYTFREGSGSQRIGDLEPPFIF